jgi:putrescine transport system ATP-binding protein
VYEYPNSRHSAEFVGLVNLFEGEIEKITHDYTLIRCSVMQKPIRLDHGSSLTEGLPLTIAVRPEKIHFSPEPSEAFNAASGTVDEIAYLGDVSIYHVLLPSGKRVLVTLPNTNRFRKGVPTWGDTVHLYWEAESCASLMT